MHSQVWIQNKGTKELTVQEVNNICQWGPKPTGHFWGSSPIPAQERYKLLTLWNLFFCFLHETGMQPIFLQAGPFFLSSLSSHILHPLGPIPSSTHTKRPAGSSLFHGAAYLLLREESVVISLKLTDVGVEVMYTGLTECIRAILSVVRKCLLKKQGQDASRVLANSVGRTGAIVLQGGDLPCIFSTWVQLSASHMGP